MNRFTIHHDIDCDAEEYWRLFLDPRFTERHYVEGIHFAEYRVVEQRETPENVERRVEAVPEVHLPKPIAKLFGARFQYVEEGVFDKAARVFKYRTIPNALADKIRNEGAIRVEALDGSRVRRTIDVSVDVRIPVLGGAMESLAEKNLRDGWEASARFTNAWLAEAKKAGATSS